eukprot:TRINITY_DN1598_c0_g2_i2.p1 TRINITY_DN1598_c0_g2~~TRINITY_DN1598_c0_g2_i2.p1  ORF type:complete len:308 (-),score=50.89 TRINITY_DN1598_c0_g2_i2:252-1070(-)
MTNDLTIERCAHEGKDSSLSEQISALPADERNICARTDDLTMEVKQRGETAMEFTAQDFSTSERSLERSLEPSDDDIIKEIQNMHSRLYKIEHVLQTMEAKDMGETAMGLTAQLDSISEHPLERSLEPRYDDMINKIQDMHSRLSKIELGRQSSEPTVVWEKESEKSASMLKPTVVWEEEVRRVSEKSASMLKPTESASMLKPTVVWEEEVRRVSEKSASMLKPTVVWEEEVRRGSEKSASMLDRMDKVSQHLCHFEDSGDRSSGGKPGAEA